MKSQDLLSVRGSLRIVHVPPATLGAAHCLPPDVVDSLLRSGECRASCHYENLVVDDGLSIIRAMLGSGLNFPGTGAFGVSSVGDLALASMKVGTASAPPAPSVTDTDVSTATYQTSGVTVFYPSATSITIVSAVPQAESSLDGVEITEEGLFCSNGAMLARVTFPAEVKIPTHAIQFEHTITIGRP